MKKTSLIFILFILMINCLIVNIEATEENIPVEPAKEQSSEMFEEPTEAFSIENKLTTITARAKVIEAGQVIEHNIENIKEVTQEVKVIITGGEYKGEEFATNYVLSYDIEGKIVGYKLSDGNNVIVQITEDESGNITAIVIDVVRSGYITFMFILFLGSIILIGGKKGLKAVLALLITFLAIYFILIKLIFQGYSAIWSSVGTATLITISTLVIIGGINKKVLTAGIGTLGGVISAGIIASIFSYLAKMSGACEEAIQLSINMTTINFNFRELLFSGIIIASLGACMDVGMSIASSLDELKSKMSEIHWKELFKSGMNIGKDIIGTMSNTLILVYVGSSITLILLFMACNMSIIDILNKETLVEEILSAIASSMGVVFTVPITAFTYSLLNRDKTIYNSKPANKINGKRTLKL